MEEAAEPVPWRALGLLALGAALLFGWRLGSRSLENQDIIRNADIAAEMLRSGDWLVPRSCDTVYVEKPPLFIWAAAGTGRLLGWKPKVGLEDAVERTLVYFLEEHRRLREQAG